MVTYYYGPWSDGPLTTEVHDIGAGTITRTTEYPVASPAASGWDVAGWRSWSTTGSASEAIPGGLSTPPTIGPDISAAAWGAAYAAPVVDGVGGVVNGWIAHPPMQLSNDGLGTWNHQETWTMSGGYWKFRYRRPSNNLQANVAPPFEEWPEGVAGIQFDYPPPGNISQYWIDLLSVRVEGTGSGTWLLKIKEPNDTGAWFGDGNDPEDISDNASAGASGAEVQGTVTLDVAPFEAFVIENVESGEVSQYDLRWLSGSVVHAPQFPGPYGATDYAQGYGPESCGRIVVTYRPPRWRYVYDRPIAIPTPYRRIFPRHDSLAGGATRNYPPSRAVQTSNRIGGGYL